RGRGNQGVRARGEVSRQGIAAILSSTQPIPFEASCKREKRAMAVNGIIGIKLGMTQVFAEDGSLVGCTVLQAGPCVVVERRTKDKDGYEAAQLGLVEFVKPQRVNKAMSGHFKKANVAPMKVLHEVRLPESKEIGRAHV